MANSDNKRLVKNTGFLYIRQLFTMAVSLYTSSVVVRELGQSDFGIYGVVGGVVTIFIFLSHAMITSIGRFLAMDLAQGNLERLKRVFSTSVNIQLLLSLGVVLIIETIGVWFLNHKMEIPPDRLTAANWVLQCAAITFVLNMISIPYNSAIIAHERMNAFAYISILESLLKLGIAFLLMIKVYDSLITYAVLTMLCALAIRSVYASYCTRHFAECRYSFSFDKTTFKEIFSFSGWNFIGAIAAALRNQGVNILMNLFFGTIINAAQTLATQVLTSVQSFAQNFMTALNPQILKSYATENLNRCRTLVMTGSRLAYYLLMALSIPILVSTPDLMRLWLKEVPEMTVLFVRMALILGMSDMLSNTLLIAIQAAGDVKKYQLVVGTLQMMIFPFVYIAYKFGAPPVYSYFICLAISQISLFARVTLVKKYLRMTLLQFVNNVYWRAIGVATIAFIPIYFFYSWLPHDIWGILVMGVISACWSLATIILVGCTSSERVMLGNVINKFVNKVHTK